MNWITPEELLLIHARVIDETGGAYGVINADVLASALLRPFTSFGGHEAFPTLLDKVACLVHSIIAFHPVADGNKRPALVAADVTLRLNTMRLTPSDAVEPFFWEVARGEHDERRIAAWLAAPTEPDPSLGAAQ